MLVGYMRVSTDGGDRQVLDLQRDALLAAGVDERHLFEDRASGSRDDRAGLDFDRFCSADEAISGFLEPNGFQRLEDRCSRFACCF